MSVTRGRPPRPKGLRLYPFMREIMENPMMRSEPHAEMCGFLERCIGNIIYPNRTNTRALQRKGMMLVPRGLVKTGIGSIGLPLNYLTYNPNGRVLLTAATANLAEERLRSIKEVIKHGERFNANYGDWFTGNTQWNEQGIRIVPRTMVLKEPSIDTAGVDKEKTGGHYELIVCDDLHNKKNVQRQSQRDKAWIYLQSLYSLLQPGGALIVIGTRWHEDDAYGRQIKKDDEAVKRGDAPGYEYLIRGAFKENGDLYAPNILSNEVLAQFRRDLDPWMFASQYLNQTMDDSERVFKSENMHHWAGAFLSGDTPYLAIDTVA